MAIKDVNGVKIYICNQCGYTWKPKLSNTLVWRCANRKCISRRWNKPKREYFKNAAYKEKLSKRMRARRKSG